MADASENNGVRDAALLTGEARHASHCKYRRGVILLGMGFFGVFGGFQAAQGLQTSENATLGFINLAALYGTFTIVSLVAPPLLAAMEALIGLRVVLLLAALAYAAMALSNIYTKHWALPITMNVLVGAAAPFLWTGQNDFVGRCAYRAALASRNSATMNAEVSGEPSGSCEAAEAEPDEDYKKTMTASFNSLFFSIYQFSGCVGNIAASVCMLVFADKSWLKDVLFCGLAAFSCFGAATFLLLPYVPGASNAVADQSGGSPAAGEDHPSLKAVAILVVRNMRMTLLVPLIFTNGLFLAFVFGDYATDIVCPVAGDSFIGFILATFFATNSVATFCWGKLVTKKIVNRLGAFMISTSCLVAFLIIKIVWNHPNNYVHADGKWIQPIGAAAPAWHDVLVVFLLVALFAVGDAFWESGPPAILQNYFLGTSDVVPALANYKLWQSLGFSVQFVLGAELSSHPNLRGGIILGFCFVSAASILKLNCIAPME